MKTSRTLWPLGLAAALALGACSTGTPKVSAVDNQAEPTVLLVPLRVEDPAHGSGCWAQFYSKRDFQGDVVTLVGPPPCRASTRARRASCSATSTA